MIVRDLGSHDDPEAGPLPVVDPPSLADEVRDKNPTVALDQVDEKYCTTKLEIWAYYAYYAGNNELSLFNFAPTAFQNLLYQAAGGSNTLSFAGSPRSINGIVLLCNGISFAVQIVVFLVIGSFPDFGNWRPNILIVLSIVAYALGFAWLGIHTGDKWHIGAGLYITGLIAYQNTLTFWSAASPGLARNTPEMKYHADDLASWNISREEYDFADTMKRREGVVALASSQPAEIFYFYQAYKVELATKPYKERNIAKKCTTETSGCTFRQFLDYIVDARSRTAIDRNPTWGDMIDTVDDKDFPTISRPLRDARFEVQYDLSKLIEDTSKIASFAPTCVVDERTKIATALTILKEHRVADNMRYFIRELESQLGLTLERRSATTLDGLAWTAYNTDATKQRMLDSADAIIDPDEKQKAKAKDKSLPSQIQKLVTKMRSSSYMTTDVFFKEHQAVIARASRTLKKIGGKKLCS
ncbi:autophagy protein [Penicillium cataractarum]|uniref:Autophagy-related protein n=1 Tax=Penicillium cataractarum TaxID=2100454 RepID=A0A9W9SP01_9EURO|nr:autophagy protein [Penicillium cataractarum]KAJ5381812.1 autophagy protein [Penicillium cataractarum]